MIGKWWSLTGLALSALAVWTLGAADAQAQNSNGELFFVHGLPGDDLDTDMVDVPNNLPVDVCVGLPGNLNCIFAGVEFGTFSTPLSLSPGNYQVTVALADPDNPGANPPVITGTISLRSRQSVTFVAHLSTNGVPVGTAFLNSQQRIMTGKSRLVVRHVANAPAVDVTLTSPINLPGTAVLGLTNPRQSNPTDLQAGPFVARLTPAGQPQTNLLPAAPLVLSPLNAYYVYAVGSPGTTLRLLVQRVPLQRRLLP